MRLAGDGQARPSIVKRLKSLSERQTEMKRRQPRRTGRPRAPEAAAPLEMRRFVAAKVRAYLMLRCRRNYSDVADRLSRDLGRYTSVEQVEAWVRDGCPLIPME